MATLRKVQATFDKSDRDRSDKMYLTIILISKFIGEVAPEWNYKARLFWRQRVSGGLRGVNLWSAGHVVYGISRDLSRHFPSKKVSSKETFSLNVYKKSNLQHNVT